MKSTENTIIMPAIIVSVDTPANESLYLRAKKITAGTARPISPSRMYNGFTAYRKPHADASAAMVMASLTASSPASAFAAASLSPGIRAFWRRVHNCGIYASRIMTAAAQRSHCNEFL